MLPSAESSRQKGCSDGRKCAFLHADRSHKPNRNSKKDGKTGKASVTMMWNVTKLGCVSQDIDSLPEISVCSALKKSTRSLRSDLRLRYSPAAERSIKVREKKGTSLDVIQPTYPHERSCFAAKIQGSLFKRRRKGKTLRLLHIFHFISYTVLLSTTANTTVLWCAVLGEHLSRPFLRLLLLLVRVFCVFPFFLSVSFVLSTPQGRNVKVR